MQKSKFLLRNLNKNVSSGFCFVLKQKNFFSVFFKFRFESVFPKSKSRRFGIGEKRQIFIQGVAFLSTFFQNSDRLEFANRIEEKEFFVFFFQSNRINEYK